MFEDAETNPPDAYWVYDKPPVVFIARRQRGAGRLHVQFQELGHRRAHYPNARFFINLDNKVEFGSNIVAARALLPFPLPRSHDICRLEKADRLSSDVAPTTFDLTPGKVQR